MSEVTTNTTDSQETEAQTEVQEEQKGVKHIELSTSGEDKELPDPVAEREATEHDPLADIPEQFRADTVEESLKKLNESYKSLQSEYSKLKNGEEKDAEADANDKSKEAKEAEAEARKVLDMNVYDDLGKKYWDNGGKFGDEDLEQIASEYNVAPEMVDRVMYLEQYHAQQETQRLYDSVGGEEKYNEIIEYAKGLPEDDRRAYQKAFDSNDWGTFKITLESLQARMSRDGASVETGKSTQPVAKGSGRVTERPPFESAAEMTNYYVKHVRGSNDPRVKAKFMEMSERSQAAWKNS